MESVEINLAHLGLSGQNGEPPAYYDDEESDKNAKRAALGADSAAKESRFGWVVVAAVFCIHIIVDGLTNSYGELYRIIQTRFGADDVLTSMVLSVQIGVTYGCGPLASYMDSKLGSRITAVIGAVTATFATVICVLTTSVWQMILVYGGLTGLGYGLMYLPAIISVSAWFERRRALAIAIAVSGSGVGTFAFNPLTEFLLRTLGFNTCMLIRAGITITGIAFALFLLPAPAPESKPSDEIIATRKKETGSIPKRIWIWLKKSADWSLFASFGFVLYCVSSFLGGFAAYVPNVYQSDRAADVSDIPKTETSWLVAIGGITNIVGRLLAGVVSDRNCMDNVMTYGFYCVVAGAVTCVSVYCCTFVEYAVYAAAFGFAGGAIIAIQTLALTDIVGIQRLSNAFGVLLLVQGIAVFIGPPFAGYLIELTSGQYYLCFVVFGIIQIVCGCLVLPTAIRHIWGRKRQLILAKAIDQRPRSAIYTHTASRV